MILLFNQNRGLKISMNCFFLDLIDCLKFSEMAQDFDDTKLQSLSEHANFFDRVKLKTDLIGLYSSQTV